MILGSLPAIQAAKIRMQRRPDRAVLLIGATGAFGERLAEGLIRSGIAVIGAARNTARLDVLARRLGASRPNRSTGPASTQPACTHCARDGRACSLWQMHPDRFRPATIGCRVPLSARVCITST